MEKRSSAGNSEQNGSANTTADQSTSEQHQEASDSSDSANKQAITGNEPANEPSPEESAVSGSTSGPATTDAGEAAIERPSVNSPSRGSAKNPAAVSLGRLGGLKGGKARAQSLTAEERREAARRAATARWQKKKQTK
jgi:hypothetical protein